MNLGCQSHSQCLFAENAQLSHFGYHIPQSSSIEMVELRQKEPLQSFKKNPGIFNFPANYGGDRQIYPTVGLYYPYNLSFPLQSALPPYHAQDNALAFKGPFDQIGRIQENNKFPFWLKEYDPNHTSAHLYANGICQRGPGPEITNPLNPGKKEQKIKKTSLHGEIEEENLGDLSLSKFHKKLDCEDSLVGKACIRRNIHKSVIRHMDLFIHRNGEQMTSILKEAGYTEGYIKKVYKKLEDYHIYQRDQGNKRMAQSIIRNTLVRKVFSLI